MPAGAQVMRQLPIPRHHQQIAARLTNLGQIFAQLRAAGCAVMTQDHPAQTFRQGGRYRARVEQAGFIGEQPYRGYSATNPRLDGDAPANQPDIHG